MTPAMIQVEKMQKILTAARHIFCLMVLAIYFGAMRESSASELDLQAIAILSGRCHACHGVEHRYRKLNVLDRQSLLENAGRPGHEQAFVSPGDVEASILWQVIKDDTMPEGEPLSDREKQTIFQWIEAGAKWPEEPARPFISELDVLKEISAHLDQIDKKQRRFHRYFSLAHNHNNRTISERDLRIHRAALSKAVNSMSVKSSIVVPDPIDASHTIYHIDLRDYGWQDVETWQNVIEAYPYGIRPSADSMKIDEYEKIRDLYGNALFDGVPYLRADWFIATATRPPIYHVLTQTPDDLNGLLQPLEVNVEADFRLNTSRRAGLMNSGVSSQNRLIEYHKSKLGTLWISYDFSPDAAKTNLARFPLGPAFDSKDFSEFAFVHAGGEIIYELPNRMHAYMLVDKDGKRLDKAPIEIVSDPMNTSGSPSIVNGISCIQCHKHGMLPFTDSVRKANAVQDAEARRKIEAIFPPQDEIDRELARSRSEYLRHLQLAIGEFLQVDENNSATLVDFEEPISRVTEIYRKNLDLEAVACELGLDDQDRLKSQLDTNHLKKLGLGTLAVPRGSIKRAFWEADEGAISLFQRTAFDLNLGSPVNN